MFAKLRCASGSACRSFAPMTVCSTLLVVSSGWEASDGRAACTVTACFTASGCSTTSIEAVEPTRTTTVVVDGANPFAVATSW